MKIKTKNVKNSLKLKLIAIMSVLIVLPLLASMATSQYYLIREYNEELSSNHQELANNIALNVNAFMDKNYKLSKMLVDMPQVKNFDAKFQKQVVDILGNENKAFDLLYIQNASGMQTARTKGNLADRSKRWWFIDMLKKQESFVSKSYYSVSTNMPVTSIFLPITNEKGEFKGVYGADIKLDYLQSVVEELSVNGKQAFIIDSEGVVVAHPDENQVLELYNYIEGTKTVLQKDSNGDVLKDSDGNEVTKSEEIVIPQELKDASQKALAGNVGTVKYKNPDGKNMVSAYNSITMPGKSDNWAVITFQEKETAFAFVNQARDRMLMIAVGMILAALALLFIAIERTVKPLRRLTVLTDEIAAGNLNVEIDIKSDDEVGHLAKSMQLLTQRLASYIDYIEEISFALDEFGDGNLDIELKLDYDGEFATIKESLLKASSNFKDTLTDIVHIANQVASGSDQVSSGSQMLAQATTQQASSLEQLSDTIDQISEQVGQNAADALNATKYVKTVGNAANTSQEHMQLMMAAIDEINYKSLEISKIIKTIDDIAFQTNILALNAAVEAARAGKLGKGFAVVAGEVRNLANKSSEAAQNTTLLIEDSVKAVKNGTSIARDTGKVLSQVIEGVNKTVELIEGISEASNSQSHAITQAMESLEQISSVVHTNSATAEESSASSEELYAQSETLQTLTAKFKI